MAEKLTLVVVSFISLFLELSLIRWVPSHVFSVAFFSNVVLIASFLGLGIGLLLTEKKFDMFNAFPWVLAGGSILILLLENIQITLPSDAQAWIWSYYQGNRLYVPPFKIPIIGVLGIVFFITAIIFIPLGQKIGTLMKAFPPLYGYTLNVIGSLGGVIFFAIISFFNAPAYIWFLVIAVLVIAILFNKRGLIKPVLILSCLVVIIAIAERDITWSPYYSIELLRDPDKGLSLYVNQLFHQKAVNFEKEKYAEEKYSLPYRLFKPKRILIIGAGTGNDVWVALKSGVTHIDAVEIDPVILQIGKKEHPQQPYESDIVRVFVDDARSFMHKASGPYDMIVYGTLDSHATLSVTSSIRLDNYTYTHEALQDAKQLLSKDGVITLFFSVPTDWMKARLLEIMRSVFMEEEVRYVVTEPYLFNLIIFSGPGLGKALSSYPDLAKNLSMLPPKTSTKVPSDDWPYLYLEKQGIPRLYLATLIMLLGLSAIAIFMLSPIKGGKVSLFFFSLGCGFLLLEAKSVTTLSLLFGSTWIVNAVVFSAILFLALMANWLVMARGLKTTAWLFACLSASLVISYFFPLTILLRLGFFIKVIMAGFLVGLPIFFAAIIFAIMFKNTRYAGIALGSNLMGAVAGGFMEYGSMILGLRALYILALAWYLIAGFCLVENRHRVGVAKRA